MKSSTFNKMTLFTALIILLMFGGVIIYNDPFFHYHKPLNNDYHLEEGNMRYYNDGFLKHFDYDSIILGTSMCHNFRTSTLETLFDVNEAIKICASGAYFNETNAYLKEAFTYNPDIKLIVRGIDLDYLLMEKDEESRYIEEAYYLRDNNIFNDVNYIFNKRVMLEISKPPMTDCDEYLNWGHQVQTGRDVIIKGPVSYPEIIPAQKEPDSETCQKIQANISQNITDIMRENPNTEFYLFLTPYSILAWGDWFTAGELDIQIQAQKIAIEQILQCENARLFSLCNDFDVVCNLDNYIDTKHYAEWINEDILNYMYQGNYEITSENYSQYLEEITSFYMTYPYAGLNEG